MEISVYQGRITRIKALPNNETPKFMQRVLNSGLLERLVGKTVAEAKDTELDAVSGATFSSTSLIQNIKRGLEDGGATAARRGGRVLRDSPSGEVQGEGRRHSEHRR